MPATIRAVGASRSSRPSDDHHCQPHAAVGDGRGTRPVAGVPRRGGGGAETNLAPAPAARTELGELAWRLSLAPGDSGEITIGFRVELAKGWN
ncbi:hypothetical protein NKG94_12350 [Micromonospora sp. M12]